MKKTLYMSFFIFVFLFSEIVPGYAQDKQDARIYGRVILPVVKKTRRAFRGRLYRNRLSSSKRFSRSSAHEHSSFEDVIIAAYPLSFKADVKPLKKARILQKNAEFIPHVLPVTPGTVVEFINADHFFHNVFSISPGATFNIGRRPTNTIVRETIRKSGDISLFCDIHSQMASTIVSLDTPYFTTANRNGVYLLDNLPPGKYRIEVIHPDFEKQTVEIVLKAGESSQQSFTLFE